MNNELLAWKASAAAFIGILGDFLGWKGVLMVILVILMALDYLSGTLAAKKNGEWSSEVARKGLFHKGGVMITVMVALLFDLATMFFIPVIPIFGGFTNPGLFLPLVFAWFIITEMGSILENADKMGAPVPKWFRKAIAQTGKAVDKAGEANIKEEAETHDGE